MADLGNLIKIHEHVPAEAPLPVAPAPVETPAPTPAPEPVPELVPV